MRDRQNIQSLCSLPIDYIGFIFYEKSPRHAPVALTPETAKGIPLQIKKTGVFVNESISTMLSLASTYSLDAVQLHGSESPETCLALKTQGLETIKAFGIDENFDFTQLSGYSNSCDYFLFDTKSPKHGGTGVKFDWNILRNYDNKKPIFLSGGITADDAETIRSLSWLNIHALDLNSKFETEPGLKDIPSLKRFFSQLL